MQDKLRKLKIASHSHEVFNREIAFSRTIGLVTNTELEILKNKTVAVAGLGGVGGSHVLTLVRLGIGGINIADMDSFAVENFNRQTGANMNSIGQQKVQVIESMATAINPDLKIKTFAQGVNAQNLVEFFSGVDAYIDGLDFFAFEARKMVFRHCHQNGIPATTVGPIGMGAALINFLPGQMSFDDYFQWNETDSEVELAVKFLLGLSPKTPHRKYIVDHSALNFKEKKGPSTPMGCELSAGVAGTEILKILLKRGSVYSAPHSILYDAYFNRRFHTHLWWGNRNPIQRLKIAIAKRILNK